ncbi:hypothetical protein Poli38472_006099 [Pythium oligandrum]|uniref:LAA1-like C-terminal TPR repeats domain-containing protein n=1 Tax=Pythium oligandrum TaxID=41045 RepID=A0A8K1CRS5_PYTOL|nr:hypothetical protein Poli38472_006099 [Pythium oligandrum]|eukprot:TMW68631.1 hypothetical protein Poli38472_006099 [Pythium oligandrum]
MEGSEQRLSACLDELRAASGSADPQPQQKRLLQELVALQERWNAAAAQGKPAPGGLFQLLLQALLVYSGNHTGGSGAGASGASSSMSLPLMSSSIMTSECVQHLICDLLTKTYDYSAAAVVNEYLSGKQASIYVRTSLVMVLARLPLQEINQFVGEVVGFASRSIKSADYYMKQCLLESVTRILNQDNTRLSAHHSEALKIVGKTFQDKTPEVRIAAAGLLHAIATYTTTSGQAPQSGGSSSAPNSNGSASGANGASNGASVGNGPPSGGVGVTLDAIMSTAVKGMDDAAPEARRAFSVVVGIALAKYASSGMYDLHGDTGTPVSSGRGDEEGGAGNDGEPGSNGSQGGVSKSKLGFRMHVPGMATITHLSRRKTVTNDFSSIANVILYLKDTVASKYLSSSQSQQHHGGILASYAIALCSMFERLAPDSIAEDQLSDVVDAIVAILDYSLTLPDLTRARNSVCYVLRFGFHVALSEGLQEKLLGVYLERGVDESNHHKALSVLVEISHLVQSLGETSIVHAKEAIRVLHGLLSHEKQSIRFQASVAMGSLLTTLTYKLKVGLQDCLSSLRDTTSLLLKDNGARGMISFSDEDNSNGKTHLYAIQGYSTAIAHVIRALVLQQPASGLSHSILTSIMNLAERLIESQFIDGCSDSIWLTCTRAGWNLASSLVTVKDDVWIQQALPKLTELWLRSSVLHTREASLELLRIEAAVIALQSFLHACPKVVTDSPSLQMLISHVLHAYLMATQGQLRSPQKRRGQIARYRVLAWLMKCYILLPPVYSDSYLTLLDFIAEFTTAQSLTNLYQSSLLPAESTFLCNALSGADDPLEMVSLARLVPGEDPNVLYSRELNHIMALLQLENTLTDTEVEMQYLDTFQGLACEITSKNDLYDRGSCSSFTYVRLVDTSILLFGRMFHYLPEELQLRCLQHFGSALGDVRVDCELNVCSLLFAVAKQAKQMTQTGVAGAATSASIANASWPQQIQSMLGDMLSSERSTVRRGAGEALGLVTSALPEANQRAVVQELEKRLSPDRAPSSGNVDVTLLAAGTAFALACIKRSCGSGIPVDSNLIFQFAGEIDQPLRSWIIHSWSLIVDSASSSGGDYEQYITSSCSLIQAHLLAGFKYSHSNKKCQRWHVSARVAIGRIINGLVSILGPELDTSRERLAEFYTFWGLLRQDGETRVELEYLKFIEQVVVFAPSAVQHSDLTYILSIVSDGFVNPVLSTGAASPSTTDMTTRDSFGSLGTQHTRNALVCVNGLSRTILQQVGMSCLRTLAERDPTLIRRHNLQCLLFHALHVEYKALMWRYLPSLHGMWDFVAFKLYIPCKTRDGWIEIRNTILALIDIDGGNWRGCQPCTWALLCRGIATGESGKPTNVDSDQLMMSPKSGFDGVLPGLSGSSESDWANEARSSFSSHPNTSSHASTGAVSAQVEQWRSTKRHVSDLLAMLPPLSRQVRRFAIECVVRVFELVGRGTEDRVKPHFDLIEARQRFLDNVSTDQVFDGAVEPANYLSMYVDEFVTLSCHVATSSVSGNELPIFQYDGLRLLNMLLTRFASAKDPEVSTGEAYVLDPYQAQISSAIRHAVKQVQATTTLDGDEHEFYTPLAIEAFALCGESVRARLVQDKVALGRILRMVLTKDYGHAHCIDDDETTRTALSLANLGCIANLLVSCVESAQADERANALVKAMTSNLSTSLDHLVSSWMDATLSYGVLMQGFGQWPGATAKRERYLVHSKVLKLVLPMGLGPSQSQTAFVDALRAVFKRYWPVIPSAIAALLDVGALIKSTQITEHCVLLLTYSIFHTLTCVRDRVEGEMVPVLRAMPRLLAAVADSPRYEELLRSTVQALVVLSNQTFGKVRIAALDALFVCLNDKTRRWEETPGLLGVAAQAALCPLTIAAHISNPTEQQRAMLDRDEPFLGELLRHAASGIIFLHTRESARRFVLEAIPLLDRSHGMFVQRPEHATVFATLHRAAIEATMAWIRASPPRGDEGEAVNEVVGTTYSMVVRLLRDTLAKNSGNDQALQLVMRLISNLAVAAPPSLAHVSSAFHAAIATQVQQVLEAPASSSQAATLISGSRAIIQRLAEAQDVNSQRYLAALSPIMIKRVVSSSIKPEQLDELREADEFLRLLSSQLNDAHGTAFVRLLLPQLSTVLERPPPGDLGVQTSSILARLLLCFAQTRAAAFKDVVVSMAPASRSVLEATLRSALTGGAAPTPAASSSGGFAAPAAARLDLSRYR